MKGIRAVTQETSYPPGTPVDARGQVGRRGRATPPSLANRLALAVRWRAEAELLRRRAATPQAEVLESCAAELEAWTQAWELEVLTLKEAAAESGYSYSALEKMIRSGAITNAGVLRAPRILRRDLPRKLRRGRQAIPEISALALYE